MSLTVTRKTGDWDISAENTVTIMGGDPTNPSWDDYLEGINVKWRNHIVVLGEYVKKHCYKITGQDQNNDYFEFSDGTIFAFSWRGWGDFMQALVNEREGYMAYYM